MKEKCIRFARLPPRWRDFNPIEMLWASVERLEAQSISHGSVKTKFGTFCGRNLPATGYAEEPHARRRSAFHLWIRTAWVDDELVELREPETIAWMIRSIKNPTGALSASG
jgi:hypothetical protein